ncbi:MAG: hypothetical protein WD041_00740, partial [Nitriliruptoraceae bacterium]
MSGVPTPPPEVRPPWVLAPTTVPRLLAGGGLVVAGLVAGRPDVVVLGIPLVLAVLWGLTRRPDARAAAGTDAGTDGATGVAPAATLSELRLASAHRRLEARVS